MCEKFRNLPEEIQIKGKKRLYWCMLTVSFTTFIMWPINDETNACIFAIVCISIFFGIECYAISQLVYKYEWEKMSDAICLTTPIILV